MRSPGVSLHFLFRKRVNEKSSHLHADARPCLAGAAEYIKGSVCGNSSCSPNGENPYATIRDPPGLACKHGESSYVEMKSPSHREVPFGGTATLLGSTGRNVYDVGECVVALVALVPGGGALRLTPSLAAPPPAVTPWP